MTKKDIENDEEREEDSERDEKKKEKKEKKRGKEKKDKKEKKKEKRSESEGESEEEKEEKSEREEKKEKKEKKQYKSKEDYDVKEELEHILDKPGMFIGGMEHTPHEELIYEDGQLIFADITVPASFERLFMEIGSNISDNIDESRRKEADPGKKVVFRIEDGVMTARNGGIPIPVEIHKKHKDKYVPEVIFGFLRSSSNYKEIRHGAGTNGYGAKLVNIFSKWFSVEVGDDYNGKKYYQKWENNMSICNKPIIEDYDGEPYTEIKYELDFWRFGYEGYDDEVIKLFKRFCIDISVNSIIPVHFNDEVFYYEDIREYARLIYGSVLPNSYVHYEWPPNTKVTVRKNGIEVSKDGFTVPTARLLVIDTPHDSFNISFVNTMLTRDGGDHVTEAIRAASSSIIKKANEHAIKQGGKGNITIKDVRPHLSIILIFRAMNPDWSSQSKTTYSHDKKTNGPIKFSIDEKNLESMLKWDVMDTLLATSNDKQDRKLKQTDGKKKKHIEPFQGEDANNAGTKKSGECSLLVIEGSSASGYVKCMIGILQDKDSLGYFKLRGKMLNMMKASKEKMLKNNEIKELKRVLGLVEGTDYSLDANFNKLRYGRVIFVTDQDVDGEHIKALGLNYFHCRFPQLLERGYFEWLSTPIVRASKNGKGNKAIKKVFFTIPEYMEWRETEMKGKWDISYFKGLGTSEKEDVKYDMENNPRYVLAVYDRKAPKYLQIAFNSKLAEDRKKWILGYNEKYFKPYEDEIKISRFIDKDLVRFSVYNLYRSIPAWDGLKPSQRKILWASYLYWHWNLTKKENSYKKYKVFQFAGFVSEKTAYHHGEQNLFGTIIKMAHNFVGSNNLNYLVPKGQFGTRVEGGKDHAAPRYINTYPEWWLPYVYREEDFPLLIHEEDDGEKIEPKVMLPTIPMSLVNGVSGIATGWSTFIPCHNVLDIIDWLRNRINDDENEPLIPWYRGFKGDIYIVDKKRKGKNIVEDDDDINDPRVNDFRDIDELGKEEEKEEGEEGEEKEDDDDEDETLVVRKLKRAMVTVGKYKEYDKHVIVEELPIGVWTFNYKANLQRLLTEKKEVKQDGDEKGKGKKGKEEEKDHDKEEKKRKVMTRTLTDMKDNSDDVSVNFTLYGFKGASEVTLRLKKSYGLTNMVLMCPKEDEGDNDTFYPYRFKTTEDVIEDFYQRRRPYYEQRRLNIIDSIKKDIQMMNDRIAVILAIVEKRLKIRNVPKNKIFEMMDELGLNKEIYKGATLGNISKDEVELLLSKIEKMKIELKEYEETTGDHLWLRDLDELEDAYIQHYGYDRE